MFTALSDATRWRVLTVLATRGGGTATSVARELPVSRPAVMKHLAVLDRAGLVTSRKQGRDVLYTVRPQRLEDASQWLARLAAEWDARLARIKRIAEDAHEE